MSLAKRLLLRRVFLWLARRLGSEITDARTGQPLGRALLVPWRGRVWLIGLEQEVRAVFQPQPRLTYWRQELGFATYPPPDFSHEAPGP